MTSIMYPYDQNPRIFLTGDVQILCAFSKPSMPSAPKKRREDDDVDWTCKSRLVFEKRRVRKPFLYPHAFINECTSIYIACMFVKQTLSTPRMVFLEALINFWTHIYNHGIIESHKVFLGNKSTHLFIYVNITIVT